MRAILVCVDYSDYLAITMPYNRHHFEDVLIVTSLNDEKTRELAQKQDCQVYSTDSFYDDGAQFNKWKALEQGLDAFGRQGWLCIMDADVLWPKSINQEYIEGNLYTPFRRMMTDLSQPIPQESEWNKLPRHHVTTEWSGFTQIFHANDRALGQAPWHQTNWKHAGGADSFFQAQWRADRKIRPNWECLHLGEAGRNWCGRVTGFLDGTIPVESAQRFSELRQYMQTRRSTRNYDHEKISN